MFSTLTPRPPAPSRGSSSRTTKGGGNSNLPIINSESIRVLSNKLSSNSLNASIPPDSPESPPNYPPTSAKFTFPSSPTKSQPLPKGKSSLDSNFLNSPKVPFPPSPATQLRSHVRIVSIRSAKAAMLEQSNQKSDSIPALDKAFLESQTRAELEDLLSRADRNIQESHRDLNLAAEIGASLLAENNELRERQKSLLNGTPRTKQFSNRAELRERPSPSPRPWKNSTGFAPPVSYSPTRSRNSLEGISWDGISQSPRASSIGSLFSAEIVARDGFESKLAKERYQELDGVNYDLTIQLSQLKSEAEQAQLKHGQKLRQMERELNSLKGEYERVENRNSELEKGMLPAEDDYSDASWGRAGTMSSASSIKRLSVEIDTASKSTSPYISDDDEDHANATLQPLENQDPASTSPTEFETRAPGVGFTRGRLSSTYLTDSEVAENSAAENLDSIIDDLLQKIDELGRTNAAFSLEKQDFDERLQLAQKEVDAYRQKCEELENEHALNGIEWREPQAQIEWDPNASTSTTPSRGNQRMIQAYRRKESPRKSFPKPLYSHSSENSISSVDEYGESWKLLVPPRILKKKSSRTLASELGSEREFSSSNTSVQDGKGKGKARGPGGIRNLVYTSTRFDSQDSKTEESEDGLSALRSLRFDDPKEETRFTLDSVNGKRLDKNRRYRQGLAKNDLSTSSRRTLALHRIGLGSTAEICSDDDGSECSEQDAEEVNSNDSSYEYLRSRDYAGKEGTDYYPTGLIDRYHPRMVVTRLQGAASRQAIVTLLYVRFFVMLALAIIWALWQGPKKTLGLIDNTKPARKRL